MKAYYYQIKINNRLKDVESLELEGEYKNKKGVHIIIDDKVGPQEVNGECFKEEKAFSPFLDDYVHLSNEGCVIHSHDSDYDIYSIGFTYDDDYYDYDSSFKRGTTKSSIKKKVKDSVKEVIKSDIDILTTLLYKVDETVKII